MRGRRVGPHVQWILPPTPVVVVLFQASQREAGPTSDLRKLAGRGDVILATKKLNLLT